jgi:hypothetical protein
MTRLEVIACRLGEIAAAEGTQEIAGRHRKHVRGEIVERVIDRTARALDDTVVEAATELLEQLEIRRLTRMPTSGHRHAVG